MLAVKNLWLGLLFVAAAAFSAAGPAQAADLKAGWYVKIPYVYIWSYMAGTGQMYLRGEADFYEIPPGQYGPFTVTDGEHHAFYERDVFVSADAYGVGPAQSLTLPMGFGMTVGDQIAYLEVPWGTNYDASQMYLQLWRKRSAGADELVWEQKQSGQPNAGSTLANNTIFEGPYYFKVNVVPEPSGLACILLGLPAICFLRTSRAGRS